MGTPKLFGWISVYYFAWGNNKTKAAFHFNIFKLKFSIAIEMKYTFI